MKNFKQYLEEDFVTDYKAIRAQVAEHEATGKKPPGVFSVTSQSSEYLGKNVQGHFRPTLARVVKPKNKRSTITSSSNVAILNTDEMVREVQKTKPWLLRWVRTGRDLEQAAQLQRSTLVHELGHNFQYGRQVKAELKKYVDKNRELPDENWRSKSMVERQSTPEREGRYVKRNRQRRDAKKFNSAVPEYVRLERGLKPLNRLQKYTGYRNLDVESHARAMHHADNLYNGDYQRSVQDQMRRNPTANIESILRQERNNAITRINSDEMWMMDNKTHSASPKTIRQIHDRMGLVMADIEKDMDLTTAEKIKAFREKTLPSKATPTFNRYLSQPRPDTRIEKAVATVGARLGVVPGSKLAAATAVRAIQGVENNARALYNSRRAMTPARIKTFNKVGYSLLAAGIIGDQINRRVFVPAGGVSKWFDRNVSDRIFGQRQAVLGESYDTYKEDIRSVLLEKYSRI